MLIRLQITSSDGSSFAFEHPGPAIRMGRDPSNELALQGKGHDNISSSHAQIDLTPRGAFLSDLRSTNGTFFNGHRAQEQVRLNPGDEIRLGLTGPTLRVLVIQLIDAPPLPVRTNPAPAPQRKPPQPVSREARAASLESPLSPPAPRHPSTTRMLLLGMQQNNRKYWVGAAAALLVLIAGTTLVLGRYGGWIAGISRQTKDLGDQVADVKTETGQLGRDTRKHDQQIADHQRRLAEFEARWKEQEVLFDELRKQYAELGKFKWDLARVVAQVEEGNRGTPPRPSKVGESAPEPSARNRPTYGEEPVVLLTEPQRVSVLTVEGRWLRGMLLSLGVPPAIGMGGFRLPLKPDGTASYGGVMQFSPRAAGVPVIYMPQHYKAFQTPEDIYVYNPQKLGCESFFEFHSSHYRYAPELPSYGRLVFRRVPLKKQEILAYSDSLLKSQNTFGWRQAIIDFDSGFECRGVVSIPGANPDDLHFSMPGMGPEYLPVDSIKSIRVENGSYKFRMARSPRENSGFEFTPSPPAQARSQHTDLILLTGEMMLYNTYVANKGGSPVYIEDGRCSECNGKKIMETEFGERPCSKCKGAGVYPRLNSNH